METEQIPQEWKDAETISLYMYKGKGDTKNGKQKRNNIGQQQQINSNIKVHRGTSRRNKRKINS